MDNLMNLGKTENSKQVEYLNDIRDVGMSIVFGECNPDAFSVRFEKYLDYVEKPSEYLQAIKEVYNMMFKGECTPDDLLLKMGRYTKTIEYEDPVIEYDCLYDTPDIDDDLEELMEDEDVTILDLDDESIEALIKILDNLCEE